MKSTWACRWGVMIGLSLAGCASTDEDAAIGAQDTYESFDTPGDVGMGDVTEDTAEPPGDTSPPGDVPVIDPCADGGGCDEHATCSPDGDQPKCECNEGWTGSGTTCTYDGVIISDIDTFEAGGFTTALPGDPTRYTLIRIIAVKDGVRTVFDAGAPVEGLYYFPGVPEGTYTLELWFKPNASLVGAGPSVYVHESSERALAIGMDFSYRAGTTLLTQPTTIEVSGTLTSPWESQIELDDGDYSALEDQLVIYSRGAYLLSSAFTTSEGGGGAEGPRRGDTSLDGWAIDIHGGSMLGESRELDGGAGDELVLAHLRHSVTPPDEDPPLGLEDWYTVISWMEVGDVTLEDGGTLPVSGTFQTKAPTSVTYAYDGDSFNAHLQPFAGAITGGLLTATVFLESAAPQPKVGPYLTLAIGQDVLDPQWADPICNPDSDPCDPVACPMGCPHDTVIGLPGERTIGFDFVNPFEYGQLLGDINLSFTVEVSKQLPVGQPADRARGAFYVANSVAALTSGAVKPPLGLPRDIRVSGKDSKWSDAIRGVGTTPSITWSAPTTGTPSRYRVQVWDLNNLKTTAGGDDPRRAVVNGYVHDTSFDIPDGVLVFGHHYVVEVVAQLRGGYDPSTPYQASIDLAEARMPSGVFAPSVCHQDAIISLGEGGIETCKCPEGWVGDGLACTPLPCTLDNGGCAVDATCTNAETAICTCPDGKIHLDGGLCVLPGDNYCEAPLPLVTSATGTTDGFEPEFDLQEGNSCLAKSAGVESPDVVYTFTAPSTGSFTFTLEATYAAVLYLRSVCFEGCLGAAEKEEGSNVLSVTVSLEEGQNVFVIVDGNVNELAPNQGPYTLSVAAVPPT